MGTVMRGANLGRLLILSLAAIVLFSEQGHAQVSIEEILTITGTVESVSPGLIVVKDSQGNARTVRVQEKDKQAVALADGQFIRYPADIRITGRYRAKSLKSGENVRFKGQVSRSGRTQGEVREIWMVSGKDTANGIKVEMMGPQGFASCELVCRFTRLTRGRLIVGVPANKFTRRKSLSFRIAKDAIVHFTSDDIRRAAPGAKVSRLVAARLSTGDLLAKTLEIEVTQQTTGTQSAGDQLALKYRKLSDEPKKAPRLVRSEHFAFQTDVSDRQARILLDKLETMTGLITKYLGRAPRGVVEGYIVHDLNVWPETALKPEGVAKIRERAGVCFSSSVGAVRRSVLYSCDDHGVVQHECTHGICHLAFGSTGPTWLAEGLAEMGQYWKAGQKAVDISPGVISYLQRSEKRKLVEIAIPGRIESGTWRDYAWRWALCHLLANNPNYENRFKPLAVALMEKKPGVSFTSVYGPVAKQISFEYDLFLNSLDNGYRADLCAWQWGGKFKPLRPGRRMQTKVTAARGWQPSKLRVQQGVRYDVTAAGKWTIAKDGSEYDADGDNRGRAKLIGVVFNDYQLSKLVPLGRRTEFVAPSTGQLFLRCQDDWNKLADNGGELAIQIERKAEP